MMRKTRRSCRDGGLPGSKPAAPRCCDVSGAQHSSPFPVILFPEFPCTRAWFPVAFGIHSSMVSQADRRAPFWAGWACSVAVVSSAPIDPQISIGQRDYGRPPIPASPFPDCGASPNMHCICASWDCAQTRVSKPGKQVWVSLGCLEISTWRTQSCRKPPPAGHLFPAISMRHFLSSPRTNMLPVHIAT